MSIVVSGILCCFKFALPSLLFLLWDEVKAAHYDFDHCSHRGSLHPENPSNWQFFHPKFKISDHCNLENDSILTFPVHYTSNKCFPPAFPILPLSAYSFDVKSEHGCGRNSGPRWILSRTEEVLSVYAPYLPCDIRTQNWLYHAWVRENCRLEGFSWCKPPPFGQWSQS